MKPAGYQRGDADRENVAPFPPETFAREPQPEHPAPTGGERAAEALTPRDWFAGKALCGLLAAYSGGDVRMPPAEDAATFAYEYADAMLVERAKTRSV